MYCGQIILGLVRQVSSKFDKNIREHFANCELTVSQMALLTLLYEKGDMKVSDISSLMGLTNGTTSGIVDRLERMGFVKRVRQDQDRRVVKVLLTDRAQNLNHNFNSMLDSCLMKLFDEVDENDLNTIIEGLKILDETLDKQSKYCK